MESLGMYLRMERETRNLSLTEVAESTRIREHLLKAIEEDRYDLLPHPLYVKGYLGAYARYLGFDPGEIILRYKNHLNSLLPPAAPHESEVRTFRKPISVLKTKNKYHRSASRTITVLFLLVVSASYGFYELSQWAFSPSEKDSILVQSKGEAQRAVEAIQKEISMVGETEARDVIPMEPSSYEALEVDIGKGIEFENGRSVLRERCSEFSCNNQRAYFFTRIRVPREGKITHLWYRDGKEFHRTEIEVKPPAWTVYSYLTLRPGHAGNWMAELRDGNTILSSRSFKAVETSLF